MAIKLSTYHARPTLDTLMLRKVNQFWLSRLTCRNIRCIYVVPNSQLSRKMTFKSTTILKGILVVDL